MDVLVLLEDGEECDGAPGHGAAVGARPIAYVRSGPESEAWGRPFGHRGANQPVQDLQTDKVEITSQNHGFAVDEASLPPTVKVTHRSLFDGTNEGIAATDRPAFSVQYHPEASPGPSDSHYLFHRFVKLMEDAKG